MKTFWSDFHSPLRDADENPDRKVFLLFSLRMKMNILHNETSYSIAVTVTMHKMVENAHYMYRNQPHYHDMSDKIYINKSNSVRNIERNAQIRR